MHLIRVDFPAPLSPTRAMTSPGATWKSTWYRACTAPKLFDTPRSSRIGSLLLTFSLFRSPDRWRPVVAPPGRRHLRSRDCYTPASVQAEANEPVQTSDFFRKPSSNTTLTLSFVIACGLSRTDGTWRDVSSDLPLTRPAGGCCFLASAMASFEAASASCLIAL